MRPGALERCSVVSLLNGRVSGVLGTRLSGLVSESRCQSLQMSQCQDVEPARSTVACMSLDATECRYLVSGCADGSVCIHDLSAWRGGPRARLQQMALRRAAHGSAVAHVSWYPLDTGLFVSSGADCRVRVWDTNTLRTADTFRFTGPVHCHDMSPDAALLAVSGDSESVTLCDLRVGSSLHALRGHASGPVSACRWSPTESQLLVTGGADGHVVLWDVRSARSRLASLRSGRGRPAHVAPVSALRFTADGLALVSVAKDGAVLLWDLLTGRPRWKPAGERLRLPPSAGCQACLVCAGRALRLFAPSGCDVIGCDLTPAGRHQTLSGHIRRALACEYDPSTGRLVSSGADNNLIVWTPDLSAESVFLEHERSLKLPVQKNDTASTSVYQDQWSDED